MERYLWTEEKHAKFTKAGWWPDKTIIDYLRKHAEQRPDQIALVDKYGTYSYRDLFQAVQNVAHGLSVHGITAGDVIAHQIPNRNEGAILNLAAIFIGAVTNPIVSSYRENELEYILDKIDAKAYFAPKTYHGFDYGSMAAGLKEELSELEKIVVIEESESEKLGTSISLQQLIKTDWEAATEESQPQSTEVEPDDVSLIQFTSGTTGNPKGVLHTENTLLSAVTGEIDRLGLTDNDVIFTPSPIGHMMGIQHGYRLSLILGTKCVFLERWNPEQAIKRIAEENCTFMGGATPFVSDLAKAENITNYDTASLTTIMTAGAPVPREIIELAHETFENLTVCRGWGQTENTLPTVNSPMDPDEKILTTDGKPYGGMQVRVKQPEYAQADEDTDGELQVKGPFLFVGYFDEEKQTRGAFTEDNWFKTGDKAVVDEDGYIEIKGRIKDLIIRGGENIPVRQIEEYLHEHPAVENVAIVAMPDERLQERACMYVLPVDSDLPPTFDQLIDHLKDKNIAVQKLPERLEIVEKFSMTASGKIQKYKLREDVAEKLDMDPIQR
ncbi:AMP-binding protein [Natrononativus amylolyticus]|uniref:AMP-binding protein n=1 Tax=Natrononativus amylolyticus TaxID=2963434 RepID=UPI0020CD9EA0|nr:AMP-binding protein [Natrononativus amylolyticus]